VENPTVDFELQPHLTGSLVELRPLERGDFDALYEAAKDPLIWEQHPERDRHTIEVFRRYFEGAIESGGAFAVLERATGRMIGSSRYTNLDPEQREVEIGWTFLEAGLLGWEVQPRIEVAHDRARVSVRGSGRVPDRREQSPIAEGDSNNRRPVSEACTPSDAGWRHDTPPRIRDHAMSLATPGS
jgi:hypothetical protein